MNEILCIEGLRKKFKNKVVICDLNLKVNENRILGFVGENGAGKTTTMKMILGLLKADSGTIKVCGKYVKYGDVATNRYIGYLPDVPEYYGFMNAKQYLKFCSEISDVSLKGNMRKINDLLELVGLKEQNLRISKYSRGMKQRLGIAQALIHSPRLLICDEPTSSLDPVGRKEVLDLLKKVKSKTTVIFSTHILSDVARICDDIAFLKDGKITVSGSLEEIKSKKPCEMLSVVFDSTDDKRVFGKLLNTDMGRVEQKEKEFIIHTKDILQTEKEVLKILNENNILPISLARKEASLESLFFEEVAK